MAPEMKEETSKSVRQYVGKCECQSGGLYDRPGREPRRAAEIGGWQMPLHGLGCSFDASRHVARVEHSLIGARPERD